MVKLKDAPDKVKPFLFFGVECDPHPKQTQGTCPFCHAEKLGIESETGKWQCLKCKAGGNIYSFLRVLYDESYQQSGNVRDYNAFASERNLRPETLRAWGLVKSVTTGDWLLPGYNETGKLTNLYKLAEVGGKQRALSTPGCKLQPFGTLLLKTEHKTLYITEGWSDGMKLWETLQTLRAGANGLIKTKNPTQALAATSGVLAMPGAAAFQESWLTHLANRHVILLLDNDHPKRFPPDHPKAGKVMLHPKTRNKIIPGWDGQQRIITMAQKADTPPKSMKQIVWGDGGFDPEMTDGLDIRDIINEIGPLAGVQYLLDRVQPVQLSPKKTEPGQAVAVDPVECTTFTNLTKHYHDTLHFSRQMEDSLVVMLAVVLSTDLRGDQLWLRVIGPPGSGKSTLAEAITAAQDYIYASSLFTGFHSGYLGDKGERAKGSASLVPQMDGKTVVIKDGDTLLNSSGCNRILSELRDLYDGTSRARYRNREQGLYEGLRITFILCGTDELRSLNRTHLGERFLDCEVLGNEDTTPYLNRAIKNAFSQLSTGLANGSPDHTGVGVEDNMLVIKQATFGFIRHLKETLSSTTPPTHTTEVDNVIGALAQIVSYARAHVKRDGQDISYRPRPELATRLGAQFTRLSVCMAIVLGKQELDKTVVRILRKVAHDTCQGFRFEVMNLLASRPSLSAVQLSRKLGLAETAVRRLLYDMLEFKIIERVSRPNNSGQRGRDVHLWKLTQAIHSLWKVAFGH